MPHTKIIQHALDGTLEALDQGLAPLAAHGPKQMHQLGVVRALARQARQVRVLQRSANWILHRHDHRYTRPWRWFYRLVPFAARLQRLLMYLFFELRILCYNRRTFLNRGFTAWARFRMRRAAPEKLHPQLIPQFPAVFINFDAFTLFRLFWAKSALACPP